jgi:hypothetical protein
MHSTIVGGSSKNGSVSFDISMYGIGMAALMCLLGYVCISSRLEEYWLPCLEQLFELLWQGG